MVEVNEVLTLSFFSGGFEKLEYLECAPFNQEGFVERVVLVKNKDLKLHPVAQSNNVSSFDSVLHRGSSESLPGTQRQCAHPRCAPDKSYPR